MKSNYFEIPVKWNMSSKMTNSVQQKIYESDISKYGQPQSYSLEMNGAGCILVPNHKPLFSTQPVANITDLSPNNGSYTFVIIRAPYHGGPQLRISQGSHYFLAGKADSVYAAGEITFKNNQITQFTDQSGSYHLDNPNTLTQADYLASLEVVMTVVGVPFDKYVPHINQSKTETNHSRFGLFSKEQAMLVCAGVTGIVIYQSFCS